MLPVNGLTYAWACAYCTVTRMPRTVHVNGMDAYRHTDTRTYLTLSGRLLCQPPSLGGVGNLGELGGGVVTGERGGEGKGGGSTHEHNRMSSQLTAAVAQSQAGPQGTAHRLVHNLLLNS